jgi:hypothetical protein
LFHIRQLDSQVRFYDERKTVNFVALSLAPVILAGFPIATADRAIIFLSTMPPTLGQRLKHAREARGLSLRDVEHTTRIPVARLQDLEEDRLNTFGGMAYAKSFLRGYSSMLGVDAGEVLDQMKPPPLGGARDYRYLVETQGPWITDRNEWRAHGTPAAALPPGKSVLFVTIICLACGILIGGAVLANAYLNSKTAAATAAQNQSGAAAKSSTTASLVPDPAGESGAYVSPDALPPDKAPAGGEGNRPFAPEPAVTKAIPVPATGAPTPPKAEPVLEIVRKPLPPPPKAERVR